MTNDFAPASERLLDLPGRGIGAASQTLVELGERRGYTVGATGPGAFRLERAVRPVWATALAIVTMPLLGLGLVFLRVRSRESAMVTIFEDRSGTKARVVGEIDDEIVEHLRSQPQAPARETSQPTATGEATSPVVDPAPPQPAATSTSTSSSRAPGAARRHEPIGEVPGRSSAPDDLNDDLGEAAATVARVPTSGPAVTARPHADVLTVSVVGGDTVVLDASVVIGRQPSSDQGARPVALPYPSLSKSHLRLEPAGDRVLVTDLHSTNGVQIRAGGQSQTCEPGVGVAAPAGSTIVAGEVELRVSEIAR